MSISRLHYRKMLGLINVVVVLLSAFVVVVTIRNVLPVKADPNWLAGWQYRKSHVVNSALGAGANYQVMITVHYGSGADSGGDVYCSSHSRTDFGDVRFTAADGSTLLSYWMQSFVASNNAVFWVKITDDLSSQAATIYIYYGKSDAVTTSNGDNTFILFQDNFLLGAPNNANYLNIPTYDGSGQLAHLDIYYNPGGWHGHVYWMVMTPYPNGDATKENPSILVSEDGQTWSVPAGLANPIVPYPGSGRHNCDPDLVYNNDTDELWVYFNDALDGGASYVKLTKSSDGITWSTPVTVVTVSDAANCVSPSVVKTENNWYMWLVNTHGLGWSATSTDVELRTSSDGANWGTPSNVTGFTPTGYCVWHPHVIYIPSRNEFWALSACYKSGTDGSSCNLFMAKSNDGTSWTTQSFMVVRKGSSGTWDSGGLYRSAFLYDSVNDIFKVWYIGHTGGNTGVWRLGYAETNTVSAFNKIISNGWWHQWSTGVTRQVGNYISMSDVPTSETTNEGIQTTSAVFQAGRALYFKAYRTGSTASGTVLGSSKYNGDVNNDAITLFVYWSTLYARTRVGGTQTQSSVSLPGSTEGIYKILWISSSSVKFYKDTNNFANSATNIPSGPLCVTMYDYDTGATLWVDWVFIRSCVSVEPSHGSWGGEEQTQYTLTVTVVGAGSVSKSPDQVSYTYGTVVTLNATASVGWTFAGWSGDAFGTVNPTSVTMNADKSVTATFTQNQYTLTVTVIGSGSVSKSPSQATYTWGTNVTLNATAGVGWTFAGWSVDVSGSANPTTVNMTGNKAVTATFTQDQYTLTVTVIGGGSVSKSPSQATYTWGTVVTLNATADVGWAFASWNGDASGTVNPTTVIMTGSKSVTATFTQSIPQLYVDPPSVQKGPGDTYAPFQTSVMVNNITDLKGLDIKLTWDNDLIALTNIDFNTTLDNIWGHGDWYLAYNVTGAGYYELAAVSTSTSFTCTTATPIATLTFIAKAAVGQTSIHFALVKLSDSQARSIQAEVTDGSYTVIGPQYVPVFQTAPGSVTCRKYGEYFTVQVNVTNAIALDGFDFMIYYSPTLIKYVSVSWGELGAGTITNVDQINGILEGHVAGNAISGNRWLLNITFQDKATTIWKDGQPNKLEGKIWFHYAELSFSGVQDLVYEEGGLGQISVNDVAFTFTPIQGDLDNSGVVDISDLRTVAAYYDVKQGDPTWPAASAYDLYGDGVIDLFDLVVVGANFGYTYIP